MNDHPGPHPAPLKQISPTSLSNLETCLWRVAFARDPSFSELNRSTPAQALGEVAHEVMQRLGDSRGFDSAWDHAVTKALQKLKHQWKPAIPPSPENWPGWALTKVRAAKAWRRLSTSTANPSAGAFFGSSSAPPSPKPREPVLPGPLPWVERWLEHPVKPLAGRPDLVEEVNGETWVVDRKSSVNQGQMLETQREQLLVYCALVCGIRGTLPEYAAVETMRGTREFFSVEASEVQKVTAKALSAFELFNAAVATGLDPTHAKPSPTNCGFCPFRVACMPFFESYDKDWPISHALLIEIEAIEAQCKSNNVTAIVRYPHWRKSEEVHLIGFPFGQFAGPGQLWGTADFIGQGSSGIANWSTLVYRWN